MWDLVTRIVTLEVTGNVTPCHGISHVTCTRDMFGVKRLQVDHQRGAIRYDSDLPKLSKQLRPVLSTALLARRIVGFPGLRTLHSFGRFCDLLVGPSVAPNAILTDRKEAVCDLLYRGLICGRNRAHDDVQFRIVSG